MVLYSSHLLVTLMQYISVVNNNQSHVDNYKYCKPKDSSQTIQADPKADIHKKKVSFCIIFYIVVPLVSLHFQCNSLEIAHAQLKNICQIGP